MTVCWRVEAVSKKRYDTSKKFSRGRKGQDKKFELYLRYISKCVRK